MFEDLTTYQIIVLAGSLIGVYIKLKLDQNTDKSELMSEIRELRIKQEAHENQTSDIKQDLNKLLAAVDEIKLLLARNNLDKK